MKLINYSCPKSFEHEVWDFLYQEEGLNTVALGVIKQLQETPPRYDEFYLGAVLNEGVLLGVALMTPPYPLNLYAKDLHCVEKFCEFVKPIPRPASVLALTPLAQAFSALYEKQSGAYVTKQEQQGIYELNKITTPRLSPGDFIRATESDLQILTAYIAEFCEDIGEPSDLADCKTLAQRWIRNGQGFLWKDREGSARAIAAVSRETPTGACISYVYTPRLHRGQGFASNLVAALCQQLLDRGKHRIFLYTQMSNPTSNKIYQQIGFYKVEDSLRLSYQYN